MWSLNSVRLKTVLVSVRLEIVLILTQDRSTVCVERTIGSEIVLDTLNSKVTWLIWYLASFRLETVSVSMLDRFTVCVERTIGSEIISDAPDGTPR